MPNEIERCGVPDSTELFDAIARGDEEGVRAALDAAPERARARTKDGLSAVLSALYQRQWRIAEMLRARLAVLSVWEAAALGDVAQLQRSLDADPSAANAPAPDGMLPLGLACFFRRVEAVRALRRAGADPNMHSRNPMRVAAIHAAVGSRDRATLRALLEAGAVDVNARQQGGWTALHAAAHQGDVEGVRLLLSVGADAAQRNDDGRNAFDVAEGERAEEVRRLVSR